MVLVFALMAILFGGRRSVLFLLSSLIYLQFQMSNCAYKKARANFFQCNSRIGFTSTEGLVIYSVDGNRGRKPVAHRLSFVEMMVHYGDPHYRKNAFDARW